ncbi:hypothetical protein CCH79_00014371 [Gambusia affinis]|uniref:Uncharacterized protein n=1 Tax=Gambusia affinis TaxID=33528 RepID=A0A315UTV4_GAMAF|nr:hypothetical protein CCH79_00014371 [Gambusia affinis]
MTTRFLVEDEQNKQPRVENGGGEKSNRATPAGHTKEGINSCRGTQVVGGRRGARDEGDPYPLQLIPTTMAAATPGLGPLQLQPGSVHTTYCCSAHSRKQSGGQEGTHSCHFEPECWTSERERQTDSRNNITQFHHNSHELCGPPLSEVNSLYGCPISCLSKTH